MNGENPEAQPPPPAKVEASPKAEAPRAEKGTETPGPLKPAEQKILGITGAPGTQRENPRDALQKLAENIPAAEGGNAAPGGQETEDQRAKLDAAINKIAKRSKTDPDDYRNLAKLLGNADQGQQVAILDIVGGTKRSSLSLASPDGLSRGVNLDNPSDDAGEPNRRLKEFLEKGYTYDANDLKQVLSNRLSEVAIERQEELAKKARVEAQTNKTPEQNPGPAVKTTESAAPAAENPADAVTPPKNNLVEMPIGTTSANVGPETQSPQASAGEKQIVDPAAQDAKSARHGEADHKALIDRLNAESEARMARKAAKEAAEKAGKDELPAPETPTAVPSTQPEAQTEAATTIPQFEMATPSTQAPEQRVDEIPDKPDRILTPDEMSQYEKQEKAKTEAAKKERQEALLEHQKEKALAEQALRMKEISIRAAGREPTSRDYWQIADNDPAQPGLSAAAQEKARELVKLEQKDHETWFRENNEKRREEQDRQRAKQAVVQQAVMRFAVNLGDKLNEQSGTTNPNTRPAETPPAGDAPPIKLASTRTTEEIKVINDRIKTGGASDETKSQPIETPSNQTAPATPEQPASDGETTLVEPQTQTPAAETPTEADVPSALAEQTFSAGTPAENPNPASPIPAEQATPADQTPVVGEVPSLPGAGQSPVEQLPTINPVEKPAEAGAQEMTAEQKQQAKQDLAARFTADGASETNKSKVLVEFDKDPAAVLSAEQTIRKIIKNPDVATAATPDEVKTEDNKTATPEGGQAPSEASQDQAKTEKAENPEQQEKTIEQKRKESLGEVVFKMSEYNIAPDKQANVLAMLSANPNMLMDTANVIKNLQIEKKEDIDPQTQMHEAIKKRIQELKNKIDPDNKSENNLTDDEKNQLKALNLLNDALTKEDPEDQDKLTKGTLILAILAAIIAGTLEGLKEGIEHSAKL